MARRRSERTVPRFSQNHDSTCRDSGRIVAAMTIWLRTCGVVDEWPDEPRATAALARLHGRDPVEYDDPAVLAAATAPLAPTGRGSRSCSG